MNLEDYKNSPHLWLRLCYAAQALPKVQSQYRVVFEDPHDLDAPAKILVPDPNWMAAGMAGEVLPDVGAYLADQKVLEAYEKEHGSQEGFNWKSNGGASHPHAKPRGPMSEEECIEYLIKKDVPTSVWRDYQGNRTILRIVKTNVIPMDRTMRDAWKINQENAA